MRRLLPALLLIAACAPARSRATSTEGTAAHEARIARVESNLMRATVVRGEPAGMELSARMADYGVPAVSAAVFDRSGILWARAWGSAAEGVPADTGTLFQAASISKPVAAAAALRLVERGALDLDADVNDMLRSWRVPPGAQTADAPVTLRGLLSHTAGTTVSGFPGYASHANLPTTVQVLRGEPPANTGPVVVERTPGAEFRYSGGGFTIAQLLMSDATGRPFAELMRELVLEPFGMRHSTYEQPLPQSRSRRAAVAHDESGRPIPGRWHAYPEMAAAGLWTTPSDLARFAIGLTSAYRGAEGGPLSPAAVRTMLTPVQAGYGLGIALDTAEAGEVWLLHGGSNEGFEAYFAALADGRGAVVMTNGANGFQLAIEVLRAIAVEYDLPGFRPTVRDAIAVDSAVLATMTGHYRAVADDGRVFDVELHVVDGHLAATAPLFGFHAMPMRASAPDSFFFLGTGAGELSAERDPAGNVVAVTISGFGEPLRLGRVE